MQPRFNRIEAGLPRTKASLQLHTTHQLLNHRILHIITKHSDLSRLIQTLFKRQAKQLVHVHSGSKINARLHSLRKWTPHSARSMESFRRVTSSRGWMPLHGPAKRNRGWPCRTIRGVFEGYTWKKFTSKTEYTNTQQGLPGIRVYFAHN
jgi:hypothetical protein